MKIEYSNRFLADLQNISTESRLSFGAAVSNELELYIHKTIGQIASLPESAPSVEERQGVHVLSLVKYPYKIFYSILSDRIKIQLIRHTARRPLI